MEHNDKKPEDNVQSVQEEQAHQQVQEDELLAELIYDKTATNQVAGRKWLRKNRPEGLSEEGMDRLLALIEAQEAKVPLHNVLLIRGKEDRYYYDASIMTKEFAHLDAMIKDKDILHTIAQVTRSDCKTYPRPTEFSKMTGYPFRMSLDEVEGAAARMSLLPEYQDIGVVQASNGEKAFFSDRHISRVYAQSLLEFNEVESKMWP